MRKTIFILALTIALVLISPNVALSDTTALTYTSAGSENATVFAGVQPPTGVGAGDFVNEQATVTSPEEDFQNTALSAADDNSIVGDVVSTGSYKGSTTKLLTAKESSTEEDSTLSGVTNTPVLFAAAAAGCFVAIGAIIIVKKRANMRVPNPNTPVDKTIYYHVEVQSTANKSGYFHVNRQLTPPV